LFHRIKEGGEKGEGVGSFEFFHWLAGKGLGQGRVCDFLINMILFLLREEETRIVS
jgi:hypothetical protein